MTPTYQLYSGAVACQLTEYIFPGSIPMSRVNWVAKSDYEYVQNYKLLQAAFTKHKVKRYVDVPKLCKAKYQDNLEFCQWLKAFFDQSGAYRENYDPVAARAKGKGADTVNGNSKSVPSQPRKTRSATTTTGTRKPPSRSAASSRPVSTPSTFTSRSSAPATKPIVRGINKENNRSDPLTDAVLADANLMKKNSELNAKVSDLEATVIEVEKERDFYFEKLRNVEVMMQIHQEKGGESDPDVLVDKVFKVLYASAEDNITVGDDGEIIGGGEEEAVDESYGVEDDLVEATDDLGLVDDSRESMGQQLDELLTDA